MLESSPSLRPCSLAILLTSGEKNIDIELAFAAGKVETDELTGVGVGAAGSVWTGSAGVFVVGAAGVILEAFGD